MALTEHVKSRSVNVTTGEVVEVFYDDVEWATLEAAKAAAELPNAKTRRIAEIKREAYDRIVSDTPEYKQRNGLARWMDLKDIAEGRALDANELAEMDAFRATWGRLKAIRDASDAAEAQVLAATTVAEVDAVVF